MTTLRIFTDPDSCPAGAQLCPMLTPWREQFPVPTPFHGDRYEKTGRDYFVRAGATDCDLVICPFNWRDERQTELVGKLAQQARAWGKPLVVFCETDSELPFPVADVLVFRGSLRRSRRLPTEFPLPAFFADQMANHSARQPARNGGQPVVGFCGCAHVGAAGRPGPSARIREALHWHILSRPRLARWLQWCGIEVTRSEGKRVRYQAIGAVARAPLLRKNFLLRDQHGTLLEKAMTLPEAQRHDVVQRSVTEFQENVLASDYTLCPRGGGNWSYRFYETLCLGRVPVFFDTDCVLPYDSLISWRDYCVWVEGDQIEKTPEAILRHYQSHTAESLAQLGAKCRELWLNYLSLDGFFRNFHKLVPVANLR